MGDPRLWVAVIGLFVTIGGTWLSRELGTLKDLVVMESKAMEDRSVLRYERAVEKIDDLRKMLTERVDQEIRAGKELDDRLNARLDRQFSDLSGQVHRNADRDMVRFQFFQDRLNQQSCTEP